MCMFIVTQPCLGIIGMLSEERAPLFNQWAAGRTDRSIGEHTRHGIQGWVGNSRHIQTDFQLLKVQSEQKMQVVGSGVLG